MKDGLFVVMWFIFISFIVILLLLDLGILHRRIRFISFYDALLLSAFWIVLGLGFALVIYFIYTQKWNSGSPLSGNEAVIQYLSAYIIEKSLSLDNLFVIALIFQSLQIPITYQPRVLLWGLLGAIVMRGIMIFGGIALYQQYHWMTYIFGALLIWGAIRLFVHHDKPPQPGNNRLLKLLKRFLPVDTQANQGRFFSRIDGKRAVTPLFIAMLMVESADLIFAIDSIPAAIGISQDPFIVYSANIFAILGLRALYFVLASALQQLRYLKISLMVVLAFVGTKMMLVHHYTINSSWSFLIIALILSVGIIVSLLSKKQGPLLAASPLAGEFNKMYYLTFTGLRRVIILILGISVVIVGIIMLVTPGPAIVVIPAGLAILATEFVWARMLLKKVKHKFVHYSKETRGFFSRNTRSMEQPPQQDKDSQ